MNFAAYFRLTSYATIAAAALALFVAGGVSVWLAVTFALVTVAAWKLEGTRWQLTERIALIVILTSIPIFYLDWRVLTPLLLDGFGDSEELAQGLAATTGGSIARGSVEVAVLAHLILFLSAIKLLQRKSDRDWFFLYLISFFTVLLAAGLTVSPTFLLILLVYLLCALSAVGAFEIQKARRKVKPTQTHLLVPPDSTLFRKLPMRLWRRRYLETRRLPLVSVGLLLLIVVLALPFFLLAPRTASSALKRGGNGVSGFIGFSDNVTLGQIGQLKGNNEIFMHVRVEQGSNQPPAGLRWRGVALDEFTGKGWKKSAVAERFERKVSDSGFFKVGTTEDLSRLTAQTFIVEPVDTPVLFGAPRVLAVQGRLPFVRVDTEGAVQTRPHDQERLVYRVFSDTTEPSANMLRLDRFDYATDSKRYLELPANLDPRITSLAKEIIRESSARTGYDKARGIESYLRTHYAYTLELKAGGPDPLADFLFNVRAGHCEYFATALAVMLRTQGIATRVVNGFLPGEYNDAASAYTVRQSDAHSWVEAFFPQTNSWVTLDPTPPAGRMARTRSGLAGLLSKYSEALDLAWFQYVVGYDKQEQRSLVTSLRKQLLDFRRASSERYDQARKVLPSLVRPMLVALLLIGILLMLLFITRRVSTMGWRRGLKIWRTGREPESSRIDFYERLLSLLAKRGYKREPHQTPLEFASLVGAIEVGIVTGAYNRVRFGRQKLSPAEERELQVALAKLEEDLSR